MLDDFDDILADVNDNSQVLRLNFDSVSGLVANDTSPSNISNDGVLRSETGSQYSIDSDGFQGGIAELSGNSSGIDIANSSEINNSSQNKRSIVVNFKADDKDSGRQVIYEEGGGTRGLNIYLDNGQLYVGGWNRTGTDWTGTYLATDNISNNTWNQVILKLDSIGNENTVQSGAFSAYLNGTKFGEGVGSKLLKHANGIAIGNIKGNTRFHNGVSNGDFAFDGNIGDVQIFNRVLNQSEITILAEGFDGSVTPPTPPPSDDGISTEGQVTLDIDPSTISFNGSNGLQIPNSDEINLGVHAERSIVLNFTVDDKNSGKQVIYEEGGGTRGLNVYIDDGKLYVGGWDQQNNRWSGTFLSTDAIVDDQLHQVVLTLDTIPDSTTIQSNAFKAYLDGAIVAQGDGLELLAHADGIGLGKIQGYTRFFNPANNSSVAASGESYGFTGSISDISIFNRTLNADEVLTLAENLDNDPPTTPPPTTPPTTPPTNTPILLNPNNPGFEKGQEDWFFSKTGRANTYGEIRVVENGQAYSGDKQLFLKLPREATSNYDDQISIGQTFALSTEKRYAVEAQVKWLNPNNSLPSAIISLWARNPDEQTFSGKDFHLVADANGNTDYETLRFEFTPNENGNVLVWLGLFTHINGIDETRVYVDDFKITEIGDAIVENDPRTGNLIDNGDFSSDQNWQVTRHNPRNVGGLVQSIDSGRLRLELPGSNNPDYLNNTWAGVYQTVTLYQGVTYELSADFDRDVAPGNQTRTIMNVFAYRPQVFSNSGELLLDEEWIGPVDYEFDCNEPGNSCINDSHRQTFNITPTATADYRITFRVFGWANNGMPVKVDIDNVVLEVKP